MRTSIVTILIASVVIFAGCNSASEDPSPASEIAGEPNPSSSSEIVVGGLYATLNEDGSYGVLKVLVVDDFAVHLRSYKNSFSEVPKDLDPSVLSLGSMDDPDGFGIGHFPLAREGFWDSDPVFLMQEPVRGDELEGYRMYLDAMSR